MAGATSDVATGITAVFGTSSFGPELLNVSWDGISFEALEVTHQGTTGGRDFRSSDLYDPGTVSLDYHFDPDKPPIVTGVAETLTITFPLVSGDSSAATWSASVFVTDAGMSGNLEQIEEYTVTCKVTGDITFTAAT